MGMGGGAGSDRRVDAGDERGSIDCESHPNRSTGS